MEINPRFWGSLSVAVKAGVDFPYLLYRMIMDGDVPKVSFYKSGVKGRYIEQDLLHIFNLFKSGSFNPGAYAQKRFRMLLNLLKIYEPGVFYDLLDLRDPLPFFFSSALFPLGLMRHLREPMYAWAPAGVRM
jgi:predicted ATP-grasp superfamily ATP-dependent carboligase